MIQPCTNPCAIYLVQGEEGANSSNCDPDQGLFVHECMLMYSTSECMNPNGCTWVGMMASKLSISLEAGEPSILILGALSMVAIDTCF